MTTEQINLPPIPPYSVWQEHTYDNGFESTKSTKAVGHTNAALAQYAMQAVMEDRRARAQPVIYVDDSGTLVTRVSAEQVEAVLGPIVDEIRGTVTAQEDDREGEGGAMDSEQWAELYRLREEVKGPDGFATWKDAAVAERVARVRNERRLLDVAEQAAALTEQTKAKVEELDTAAVCAILALNSAAWNIDHLNPHRALQRVQSARDSLIKAREGVVPPPEPMIARSEVVSKPDATIEVTRLVLSDRGRDALTVTNGTLKSKLEQALTPLNGSVEYVKCPICGEHGMRKVTEDDASLIQCTNVCCLSNGGLNGTAIGMDHHHVRDLRMNKWLDPECASRGACQSLKFRPMAAAAVEGDGLDEQEFLDRLAEGQRRFDAAQQKGKTE